ncbi:MAG: Lytic transglycosylase, catalytic [Parcubacteria group bacterium GW2011_GWA2_46_9]|nr:MAG: Lytic transglycosylase, catalytic [Parcubacteria group bacterium GW2011_GWA2_46_9]
MKKEEKYACRKVSPSLRDALAVGWAWLRQRWNLLWLIPDLVLFGGAIILASAYLPKAIELAAESGSEEWMRRIIQVLATGILSVTLALTWWKGSVWLCRYNWWHRARPMSLFAVAKSGLLISAVVGLQYNSATQMLLNQLALPHPKEIVASSFCGATDKVAANQLPETNIATPVIEAAHRELTNSSDKRVFLARTFQRIQNRYAWIHLAARLYNLPSSLVPAVLIAESGTDERAVSPMGAKGLMQLMPANYAGLDPFDPVTNVELGAQLLRRLIDEHGDVAPALAHYNASNRANERAEKLAETLGANDFWLRREFLPEETREYVSRVLAYQIAWEDWQKHGRVRSFEERHGLVEAKKDTPRPPKRSVKNNKPKHRRYIVRRGDTVSSISQRNGLSQEELKRLNAGLEPGRLQVGQVLRLPSNS